MYTCMFYLGGIVIWKGHTKSERHNKWLPNQQYQSGNQNKWVRWRNIGLYCYSMTCESWHVCLEIACDNNNPVLSPCHTVTCFTTIADKLLNAENCHYLSG